MNTTLRNILAAISGIIFGSIVNMSLVSISGNIIPIPEGVDPNDIESIKENIHLFETKHFIMPFLAHALGTLTGAFIACKIWIGEKRLRPAMIVAIIFLLGGLAMVFLVPGKIIFAMIDLVFAYIPMGYLGYRLAK